MLPPDAKLLTSVRDPKNQFHYSAVCTWHHNVPSEEHTRIQQHIQDSYYRGADKHRLLSQQASDLILQLTHWEALEKLLNISESLLIVCKTK